LNKISRVHEQETKIKNIELNIVFYELNLKAIFHIQFKRLQLVEIQIRTFTIEKLKSILRFYIQMYIVLKILIDELAINKLARLSNQINRVVIENILAYIAQPGPL
jgi:CRISPR/Cas system-associated endonuclease Cas3-HD